MSTECRACITEMAAAAVEARDVSEARAAMPSQAHLMRQGTLHRGTMSVLAVAAAWAISASTHGWELRLPPACHHHAAGGLEEPTCGLGCC
jgi:hypothetical protein